MTDIDQTGPTEENWLLYDGECPFCSAYVKLVRLRENVGSISLLDARNGGVAYQEAVEAGFDLNEGMLLKLSGKYYHGKDSIHVLAMLSGKKNMFSRISGWVFRSERRAAALYPIMRFGRNIVIRILGRKRLRDESREPDYDSAPDNM